MLKYLYVDILRCSNDTYYTGVTNKAAKRLNEHNTGIDKTAYTFSRPPVEMVFCKAFSDYKLAISWEKRIKNWNRKKKEALIAGRWNQLKEYSECKKETSHKNTSRLRSK